MSERTVRSRLVMSHSDIQAHRELRSTRHRGLGLVALRETFENTGSRSPQVILSSSSHQGLPPVHTDRRRPPSRGPSPPRDEGDDGAAASTSSQGTSTDSPLTSFEKKQDAVTRTIQSRLRAIEKPARDPRRPSGRYARRQSAHPRGPERPTTPPRVPDRPATPHREPDRPVTGRRHDAGTRPRRGESGDDDGYSDYTPPPPLHQQRSARRDPHQPLEGDEARYGAHHTAAPRTVNPSVSSIFRSLETTQTEGIQQEFRQTQVAYSNVRLPTHIKFIGVRGGVKGPAKESAAVLSTSARYVETALRLAKYRTRPLPAPGQWSLRRPVRGRASSKY